MRNRLCDPAKTLKVFRTSGPAGFGRELQVLAIWLTITLMLVSHTVITQAQSASEYEVKAAFLFNFAKFVEWPSDAFASNDAPLQICVLGQDPFRREFEQVVDSKNVNGHQLEIVHPSGAAQAKSCQIVFVAASEKQQVGEILRNLQGASALTVGESEGFARMGGMINFVLDDSRVRFEINVKASQRARLKVSARLLMVAKSLVTGEDPTGNE